MKSVYLFIGWLIILGTGFNRDIHKENQELGTAGKPSFILADNHLPLNAIESLALSFSFTTINYHQNTSKSTNWRLASQLLINTLKNLGYPYTTSFSLQKSINLFALNCSSQSLNSVMRC